MARRDADDHGLPLAGYAPRIGLGLLARQPPARSTPATSVLNTRTTISIASRQQKGIPEIHNFRDALSLHSISIERIENHLIQCHFTAVLPGIGKAWPAQVALEYSHAVDISGLISI
jgi:hypothetical protein